MRTIILPVIFVALATTARSQQLFDIGLKAGANMDDLRTNYAHAPLLGGHIGLFARVKPPLFPGVQGEALISTMGTQLHIDGTEVDLRSATLQLPLFLVASFGPVELHAGGFYDHQLARTINARVALDVGDVDVQLEDLSDGYFGLMGGAGVHLGSFYAAARYNHGLDPIGTGPYLGDVRTQQVQAYLAWGFVK